MSQLISALFDRWNEQPILVIGGGPSAKTDLPKLTLTPACVISANDHGAFQKFFPVDLYVNCDKIHCMKKIPMEKILRPLGAPIVNRFSWADYRLADWTFAGNSGLTAIAVACALGGNPVLVTGIDMWKGGRVYFHDEGPAPIVPRHRREIRPSVTRRDLATMKPLKAFVAGANVRPLSGPLCEVFPKYDPAQPLPLPRPVAYRMHMQAVKPVLVRTSASYRFGNQDILPANRILALSPAEIVRMGGLVAPLHSIPDPG